MLEETTTDPVLADVRNFFKVELWTPDDRVERMLYAGSNLNRARKIFADQIRRRNSHPPPANTRAAQVALTSASMVSRSNLVEAPAQPLVIPEVATLRTLGDVRTLIQRHLPRGYWSDHNGAWSPRTLRKPRAAPIPEAATVSLMLALAMAGVACKRQTRHSNPRGARRFPRSFQQIQTLRHRPQSCC